MGETAGTAHFPSTKVEIPMQHDERTLISRVLDLARS